MTATKVFLASTMTTATLFLSGVGFYESPYPVENNKELLECCLPETENLNPYYSLIQNEMTFEEQVESIHKCVSNLLENTIDLDPKISKLIDDNFWELG